MHNWNKIIICYNFNMIIIPKTNWIGKICIFFPKICVSRPIIHNSLPFRSNSRAPLYGYLKKSYCLLQNKKASRGILPSEASRYGKIVDLPPAHLLDFIGSKATIFILGQGHRTFIKKNQHCQESCTKMFNGPVQWDSSHFSRVAWFEGSIVTARKLYIAPKIQASFRQ